MSLKERMGHFDIRETADVALIVDASETAGNYRKEIVQLTNQLIDSLPPGCAHDLFFLGCSTVYETYNNLFAIVGNLFFNFVLFHSATNTHVCPMVAEAAQYIFNFVVNYYNLDFCTTSGQK
jgi:hypothetical protein